MTKRRKQNWIAGACVLAMLAATVYIIFSPTLFGFMSDVQTEYGRRRGRASVSVNGTSVFAEMFRQSGCSVSTWMQLSPRLRRSDVIVWTPNSFELPTPEEIDYFENNWLHIDGDDRFRTLVYVARDFDAAIQYWQMQTERTQGAAFLEAKSELARAKSDHAYARSLTAKATECEWFSIQSEPAFQHVTPSDGPWAEDLDREDALYPVAGTLKLAEQTEYGLKSEVLLGSEETPLIVRITDEYDWPNGQILVLLNGTTVLNLPLVKHENRKLAAKLMAACGDDVRRVTFLESGPMGMRISNSDPKNYSGLEALSVWPVNSILLHLIVAGILFCGMVFPIFGRPRQFEEDTTSDFGKHIRAMGELLAISQDRRSAVSKVQQYRALEIEPIVVDSDNPPQETGNPFKVSRA